MTLIELFVTRVWWQYNPASPGLGSQLYRYINLAEGTVWCVLAGLVARRYILHRHSGIELGYAALFAVFGLSDYIEASWLTSWLIGMKLVILICLLIVRRIVIQNYYPTSKLY